MHREVRDIQRRIAVIDRRIDGLEQIHGRRSRRGESEADLASLRERIGKAEADRAALEATIPIAWEDARKSYLKLAGEEKKARQQYRRNVDDAYEPLVEVRKVIAGAEALGALRAPIEGLRSAIANDGSKAATDGIRAVESMLSPVAGSNPVRSKLSRVRRAMKGDEPKRDKAAEELDQALRILATEIAWRDRAAGDLATGLEAYDNAIRRTIGVRLQERLTQEQAEDVAGCLSAHRDISLSF